MKYSEMSAIDLRREIDRAEHYSEDNGTELFEALKEVERLRERLQIVCQGVIEIIDVEYRRFGNADSALNKIDDTLQRYITR